MVAYTSRLDMWFGASAQRGDSWYHRVMISCDRVRRVNTVDLQDAPKKPKEKVSAEKKGFFERPALANKTTTSIPSEMRGTYNSSCGSSK